MNIIRCDRKDIPRVLRDCTTGRIEGEVTIVVQSETTKACAVKAIESLNVNIVVEVEKK